MSDEDARLMYRKWFNRYASCHPGTALSRAEMEDVAVAAINNTANDFRARIKELEPAQGARVPEGWVLVPKDDASMPFADPLLPIEMVKAGEDAIDKADEDLRNYVSGETIDWDSGMIAVAVWRAMCAAAPPAPSAPSPREAMTEDPVLMGLDLSSTPSITAIRCPHCERFFQLAE